MPIYEDDRLTRAELDGLRKYNRCKVCGSKLDLFWSMEKQLAYLACHLDQTHSGIVREASQYEQRGMESQNIPTRREAMERQFGEETSTALAQYQGVTSLTKVQAGEIMEAIWPEAPASEKQRAALLCASYALNPLMKHIFLIPFNKGQRNESWATVVGIQATRLMASRKGTFSFIDATPRVMTEKEQIKVFGEADKDKLWAIVKVQDPNSGAETVGYGFWPKLKQVFKDGHPVFKDGEPVMVSNEPYGTDKGNSKFNMACNRAERQALSRLRPGEMPVGVEVMDEAVAESASKEGVVEGQLVSETTEDEEKEPPAAKKKTPPPKAKPAKVNVEAGELPPELDPRVMKQEEAGGDFFPVEETPPEEESPPDETPITPEQLVQLDALMKRAGMDNMELGRICNQEKKWKIQKKGDLKKWQFDALMKGISEAVGV